MVVFAGAAAADFEPAGRGSSFSPRQNAVSSVPALIPDVCMTLSVWT